MKAAGHTILLVEGGGHLLNQFIDGGLWDEARVFISKKTIGAGIAAPKLKNSALVSSEILEDDQVRFFSRCGP